MARRTIKDNEAKLRELRGTVRQYLSATRDIPKRAVDCDQELVDRLEEKLVKLTNWKDPYAKIRTR